MAKRVQAIVYIESYNFYFGLLKNTVHTFHNPC